MKKKLFIRSDGSHEIGLGHLIRCAALAYMVKEHFVITFISISIPDKIKTELIESGFEVRTIANESDFLNTLTHTDIVLLDGYHFNTAYQRLIKEIGVKLICIDDLHDKEFFSDLIINHAPGIVPQDYKAQPYTRFALGPQYALLRPSFFTKKETDRSDKIETVLTCFGGADPKNLTKGTLEILSSFPEFKKIIVITGIANNKSTELQSYRERDNRIMLFHDVDEKKMVSLIRESDLAVVPASGILYEVIALGCKPLICCSSKDQKYFHDYLVQEYSVNSFDCSDNHFHDLRNQIIKLLQNNTISKVKELRNLIGQSKENILQSINSIL